MQKTKCLRMETEFCNFGRTKTSKIGSCSVCSKWRTYRMGWTDGLRVLLLVCKALPRVNHDILIDQVNYIIDCDFSDPTVTNKLNLTLNLGLVGDFIKK